VIIIDITPAATAFGLIAIAELGDKTQLSVLALSAMYDRKKVFAGAVAAFALVTGLGVLVGKALFMLADPEVIRMLAGLLFLVFGVWILLSRPNSDRNDKAIGNPLFSTFSMIALAEMGDKTQLTAITLSARFDSPYFVFLGAFLALAAISLFILSGIAFLAGI